MHYRFKSTPTFGGFLSALSLKMLDLISLGKLHEAFEHKSLGYAFDQAQLVTVLVACGIRFLIYMQP